MSKGEKERKLILRIRRTNVEDHVGALGTTMSSMVVGRDQISSATLGVTGLAGGVLALVTVRGDIETDFAEERTGAHVDAGEVPEDLWLGKGVFVLQNVVLVGVGGDLDADATAIGVDAPVFRVGLALRHGDHLVGVFADGP